MRAKPVVWCVENVFTVSQNQAGMSLIELMVAMLLGTFLMTGVVTNFISNKDTDIKRNAVSEMDANARTLIHILRQSIGHAGYSSIYNLRLDKPFFTEDDGEIPKKNCRNGFKTQKIRNWRRTRDFGTKDRITVIAMIDNPCQPGRSSCTTQVGVNPDALVYYDCIGGGILREAKDVSCSADAVAGMPNPQEAMVFSTFWLKSRDKILMCTGSRGGTQPVVNNVQAVQYLYGVRQSNGSTVYRTATKVEDSKQWEQVTSVQVALLMRSSHQYVLKKESSKKHYILLDKRITIPRKDRQRLFRVYTTTINLENRNKGAIL